MRHQFHPLLLAEMRKDPRIYLLTADLGFGMWDAIFREFPDRAYNMGAAEQLMIGAAVGLAAEGKIPVCYTITPFYWRAAEWIRNYLDHEGAQVRLVGSGRGADYSATSGFTHDADDDVALFRSFRNVQCYWPKDAAELDTVFPQWLYSHTQPTYLNIKR